MATDIQNALRPDPPTKWTVLNTLNTMVDLALIGIDEGSGSAPNEYYPLKPESPVQPRGYEPRATSLNVVFPYPGSKGSLADWIVQQMPEHTLYVEVFGGSAGVLFNKPKLQYEVLNDLSKDIIQFFRVLRDNGDELAEWVQSVPYSRELYDNWATDFYNGYRPADEIERAGRFYSIRFMQ